MTQHSIKWIKNLLTVKSSSASVTRVSVLSRCDSNDISRRNSFSVLTVTLGYSLNDIEEKTLLLLTMA